MLRNVEKYVEKCLKVCSEMLKSMLKNVEKYVEKCWKNVERYVEKC